MKTRRSFLKSIFAAVALSPLVCRLATESVEAFQEPAETVLINPQWVDAPFEMVTIYHPDVFIMESDGTHSAGMYRNPAKIESDPPRFNFVNGEYVRVEKHL